MKKKFLLLTSLVLLAFVAMAQSPGGISAGLKVWLKADIGTSTTTNGAALSSWNDQSGGGRNHTQIATQRQPAFVGAGGGYLMNYNPAVRFAGIGDGNTANDYLSVNNYLATTEAAHVFVVSRISSATTGSSWKVTYCFTADITHADWYINQVSCRTGGVEKNNTTNSILYGINASLMPMSGNQRVIWNGVTATFGNTAYNITTGVSPTFTLGADRNNTDAFIGDIQEVIVYAGTAGADLPAATLAKVQSYLATKYGISLDATGQPDYTSSTGTVYWTGASNTGYQKNIFGLGRDDGSALNTKQAFSYGDSSMSVYLGLLAGLNSANAGSIAATNSFLMLGDNGLTGYNNSINYTSGNIFVGNGTVLTSNLNTISNRIWKAQTTTQASWTVNVNANKYATATYLLVGSATNFPLATSRAYPIVAGTAINVTVNSGDYIAFATFASGPGGISAGLQTWLKADAGTSTTTNGAGVQNWFDQSGNNRTHSQATAGNQPLYVGAGGSYLMNYNPALRFSPATQTYLTIAPYMDHATTSPQVFVVSRERIAPVDYQVTYSMYVNTLHSGWYPNGYPAFSPSSWIGGNNPLAATKTGNPLFGLSSHIFNLGTGTAPNVSTVYWNGTKTIGIANNFALNYTQYDLGRNAGSASYFMDGDIQEVIVYTSPRSTDISASSLQRIQSYLAIKYGISLDPAGQADYLASDGSTVFWTGSSNTGYQNNIFGLGRDDNSILEQKQAYSVSDSSISVYLGNNLAPLNSLNSNSITTNYSFLMLGDNGLSGITPYGTYPVGTAFANAGSSYIMNYRSNKIWKSQTTTQASWTVSINANKLSAANYVLVSTSAAFTPASTRIYPITNGVANNVVINTGEFVALGALIKAPGGVVNNLVFWSKTDDAGVTPSLKWKDNSPGNNPIETVGSLPLSAADANHNFYPYYTGFSSSNYFRDVAPVFTPSDNSYGVQTRTPFSIYSAVRATSAGTGRITGIDNDDQYAAEPGFSISAGKPYFFKFLDVTGNNVYSTTAVTNKSSIFSYNADQAANAGNGALKIGLDAVEQNFNWAAGNFFHNLGQYMFIGYGIYDLTGPFPGDIMEVAWYQKSLSTTEQPKVLSYLSLKNGVTMGTATVPINYVNTAGSTVWTTGANTFQNNVAGIGRDDMEDWNQKQSRSVNAHVTGQVTMSLGALAASNAANANTFKSDNTYMVWGDNGNTAALTNASSTFAYDGNSLNIKMARLWAITNTNGTQAVTITIPSTMITATITSLSCQKFRLITFSDAGATTITSATTNLVLGGGNYTCTYKFPAGTSYFTFGRIELGADGIVYLPAATTPSIAQSPCEELGWRYWYADAGLTKKIFAINRNSNGTVNTLDNFTGQVDYQGAPYEVTDGVNTTHMMGRTLSITDPSNAPAGTYGANGGMKVRFYIDSAEYKQCILGDILSSAWFKHDGNFAATQPDQQPDKLNHAASFIPTGGSEDGVDYVEYSGITSFSTFGFISSTFTTALPLQLLSFTGVKNTSGGVDLVWKTANEVDIARFELQSSSDAVSFISMATIAAKNNGQSNVYNQAELLLYATTYYRLKIVYANGKIAYSNIVAFSKTGNIAQTVVLYPNPVTDSKTAITVALKGYESTANAVLYNSVGQKVYTDVFANGTNQLKATNLTPGVYELIIVDTKTGNRITKKMVVK